MLKANKSSIIETIFAAYNRNLIRRKFESFFVSGLEILNNNPETPTIIYANHSSWWDGLVAFHVSRRAKLDSYVMMEEKQLRNMFIFRNLGAFSVVRENPRQAKESVDYAIEILNDKFGRTLWIFPQGEILPSDVRPLKFYNGLAHILKKNDGCRVINIAIRYEFLGSFKPEIFVRITENLTFEQTSAHRKKILSLKLSEQLTANLDRLKLDIINNETNEYRNII